MSIFSPSSVGDMVIFLAENMDAAQATPLRSAVRQVFKTVYGTEWRHVNVRDLDIDKLMDSFKNKTTTDYSEPSLRSYKSRITRAINKYLENPLETAGKAKVVAIDRPVKVSPFSPSSHSGRASFTTWAGWQGHMLQELITYPFPLSSGQIIRLSLPAKLSMADAKRISAFIETIAINDAEVQTNLDI